MSPLEHIIEGFFFALGFWPVYYGLEQLANKIPAIRRMRASKAAKLLRAMPKADVAIKPGPNPPPFNELQ
jgi:hypothetical protein